MAAVKDTGLPVNVIQSLSIRYNSVAAATAGQLVDFAGNLAILATTPVYGVLRQDAVQNEIASVATFGLVEITCGAAVPVGSPISADPTGRGIVAVATTQIFARALTATTVAGQKFQALITREGVS
jgi:hypothetical protein